MWLLTYIGEILKKGQHRGKSKHMKNIQKTIGYVLELYGLKNIRQLEELIVKKGKANKNLKEIGFLKIIVGMYYLDCGSE